MIDLDEFRKAIENAQKAIVKATMVPAEYLCHAPIYPNFSSGMAYLQEQDANHQSVKIVERFKLVVDDRITDNSWRPIAP